MYILFCACDPKGLQAREPDGLRLAAWALLVRRTCWRLGHWPPAGILASGLLTPFGDSDRNLRVLYATLPYPTLRYSILLYAALLYSTLLCSTLPSTPPTLLYATRLESTLRYPRYLPDSNLP